MGVEKGVPIPPSPPAFYLYFYKDKNKESGPKSRFGVKGGGAFWGITPKYHNTWGGRTHARSGNPQNGDTKKGRGGARGQARGGAGPYGAAGPPCPPRGRMANGGCERTTGR